MANTDSPWRPPSLRRREDLESFVYVVVEEEIDGTMGLVVAEWPEGGTGGPRFHEQGEVELAVDREALQRRLSERKVPAPAAMNDEIMAELRNRRVEAGDVFAVQSVGAFSPEADPEELRDCAWIDEALDITADAREAAKAKMYEALTSPLDPRIARRLAAAEEREVEPGGPAL
jgi:hypothetical protein